MMRNGGVAIILWWTFVWVRCTSIVQRERSVVFVKTYKTGSSTVRSVLLRDAVRRGRNAAVPVPVDRNTWNAIDPIHRRAIERSVSLNGGHAPFDLWTGHVFYNERLLDLVAGDDPLVLTVLRDPAERFLSAWGHFRHGQGVEALRAFVKRSASMTNDSEDGESVALSFDAACRQLGEARETAWIIVAERMNESLLLLKEELEWGMDDMLYVSKKVSNGRLRREDIPDDVLDDIEKASACDREMYERAVRTHERRVRAYGEERMRRDLEEFERALNEVRTVCGDGDGGRRCLPFVLDDREMVMGSSAWRRMGGDDRKRRPFTYESFVELYEEMRREGRVDENGMGRIEVDTVSSGGLLELYNNDDVIERCDTVG